jgi:hypothetical protein
MGLGVCEPPRRDVANHPRMDLSLRTRFFLFWKAHPEETSETPCSLYLSFFVEVSESQRLPERHRKRWLRRLVRKTTARRDATSGFAPVESYRATLSSPCSAYLCCRWGCMGLLQGFLRSTSLPSVPISPFGHFEHLLRACFCQPRWLIKSPTPRHGRPLSSILSVLFWPCCSCLLR